VEARVTLPGLPKRLVETLSREEIQRLEDAAASERDKLIVRVLADTGIRVGELVRLRLQDLVDRDRRFFPKVRGKGDRERLVPLAPRLYNRLRRHIGQRPQDIDSDRLFLSLRRDYRTSAYEPLTESGVQQMIRDLGERAGIVRRIHPHLFRHSAATRMLRRGMNPLLVANVLGHASLAMIQSTYAHLTATDAHAALMDGLRGEENR
jgi:integrase/recombinase XerD